MIKSLAKSVVLTIMFMGMLFIPLQVKAETITGGTSMENAVEVKSGVLYSSTNTSGWYKMKLSGKIDEIAYIGLAVDEFSYGNIMEREDKYFNTYPGTDCETIIEDGTTKYYTGYELRNWSDDYLYMKIYTTKSSTCEFMLVEQYGWSAEEPKEIEMKEVYSFYSHIGVYECTYRFTASRTGYYLVDFIKSNKTGYSYYSLEYADGEEVNPQYLINDDLYVLKQGVTYYLVVKFNGYYGNIDVSVSNQLIENISLNSNELDLRAADLTANGIQDDEAEIYYLEANINPTDAVYQDIEWTSKDSQVALVNEDGKVTAIGFGTTIITASAKDGSGVFATCEVTVKQNVRKGVKFTVDKIKYVVTSDKDGKQTVEVYGVASKTQTSYKVPKTVNFNGINFTVTSIGDSAFMKCTKAKTIYLNDSIINVGNNAFNGCKNLTKISSGENIKDIGTKAFYNCKTLITIGSKDKVVSLGNVRIIGESAFADCEKLQKVNITSKNLTEIKKQAFANCEYLQSFSASSTNLKKLGNRVFYKDKNLKYITFKTTRLSSSVVGDNAFAGIKSRCVFYVPSSKVKSYKSLFIKKGAPSNIVVKK